MLCCLFFFFLFFYERYKEDCSLFKKRISKTCLCLEKKYRNCDLIGTVILINIKKTDLHLLTSSAPHLPFSWGGPCPGREKKIL